MAKQNDRFEVIFEQSSAMGMTVTRILVDKETGVNYIYHKDGYSGGLSPLLDADGKPVVTK